MEIAWDFAVSIGLHRRDDVIGTTERAERHFHAAARGFVSLDENELVLVTNNHAKEREIGSGRSYEFLVNL